METSMTVDSNVQQYIDDLKLQLADAEKDYGQKSDKESKQKDGVQKKSELSVFMKKMLDLLKVTSDLAVAHIKLLKRARTQGEKVGKNARLGISALEIMICETQKIMNCNEDLAILIRQLSDRFVSCNVPVKDEKNSVTGIVKEIKTEVEKSVTGLKDLVTELFKTLQLQEFVSMTISGKRGLVYEFEAQKHNMLFGTRNSAHDTDDPEDLFECASCKATSKPIFPMDDPQCDFYTRLQNEYNNESKSLSEMQKALEKITTEREKAQSKKDALGAALTAALAAKSCESPN